MTLERGQVERLYKIVSILQSYAAARYGARDEAEARQVASSKTSGELGARMLGKMWDDPQAIVNLLSHKSPDLSADELRAIKILSEHINGPQLMVGVDEQGRGLFSIEDQTVAVEGLARGFDEVLPGPYPRVISIALIPFEGIVTYDGYLSDLTEGVDDVLRAELEAEMAEALARKPIADAGSFANLARRVAAEEAEEEAADAGADQGGEADVFAADPVAALKKMASKGKPCMKLADSLAACTKDELSRYAAALGLHNYSKLRKGELVDLVAPVLADASSLMQSDLAHCSEKTLTAMSKLAEGDGIVRFSEQEAAACPEACLPMAPWTRLYWTKGEFTLVMTDEVRALSVSANLKSVEGARLLVSRVGHLAKVLTEFCGMISERDFCARYRELYGTTDSDEVLLAVLEGVQRTQGVANTFGFWFDPAAPEGESQRYIIDRCMADGVVEDVDIRNQYLERLLVRHAQVADAGVCPVDPAALEQDVLDWKLGLPVSQGLGSWLAANVPDDEDGPAFADQTLRVLMKLHLEAGDPEKFVEEARKVGLFEMTKGDDDTKAGEEALAGRLMALWSALPSWDADGWTPDALYEKRTGSKVFRAEDGTILKPGRNDLCPCGSGKKYKRCHGR